MTHLEEVEPLTVELANVTTVTAHQYGYIYIDMDVESPSLCTTYLIPDIKINWLSCSWLDDRGLRTKISRKKCVFKDWDNNNKILGIVSQRNGDRLYAKNIVPLKDLRWECKLHKETRLFWGFRIYGM